MYYENVKPLAEFITTKLSYARRHKKEEVLLLLEFAEQVANLLKSKTDKIDWYSLCQIDAKNLQLKCTECVNNWEAVKISEMVEISLNEYCKKCGSAYIDIL